MTRYHDKATGRVPFTPDEEAEADQRDAAHAATEGQRASDAARAAAKAARAVAVESIKVTISTGKTFDGNEESQSRMARALLIAQATGMKFTTWTLADNSVVTVTLPELTEALALAGQEQARLWPIG